MCVQAQNGAVACQMLDRLHSGVLPIKKVDFNANQLYYHEQNWRLLQQAMQELGIDYVRTDHVALWHLLSYSLSFYAAQPTTIKLPKLCPLSHTGDRR